VNPFIDETEFFTANIECLTEEKEIPFKVFIKAGERLLRVSEENQFMFVPFLSKMKDKKIREVYIHKQDLMKYINFSLSQINGSLESSKNVMVRARTVLMTFKNLYSCIEQQGVSKDSIEMLKRLSIETMKALRLEKNNLIFFEELMKDQSTLKYTLARTAYAALICEQLGWNSPGTLAKVSIASLLSDVGLGKEIVLGTKRMEDMSDSELSFFIGHTKRSVELLANRKEVSSDVLQAILHHHENCDGSGLLGVRKLQTYPLGAVIRVADEFVSLAFAKNPKFSSLWVLNSLNDLQDDRTYNQEYVNALSNAIIHKNY
jgi:HD-GYP domain-containing protein (c-di-GMP phosphodiesterase class II)